MSRDLYTLIIPAIILFLVNATTGALASPSATEAMGVATYNGHLRLRPLLGTSGYQNGYSPQQIHSAYNLNPNYLGAGITIAIVDAFDDPQAAHDFDIFSRQFGLPTITGGCRCFTKVAQNGSVTYPAADAGWAEEISLDIEWAHAMAPLAHILLVEADSNSNANLYLAEDYATAHAQVVSNSWGGPEMGNERRTDLHFNKPVAITASAGDNGTPAQYPSASPYVLSIGGTSLTVTGACGATDWSTRGCGYGGETAWPSGGGGASAYESQPAYQSGYCAVAACGLARDTPDLAWDADPNTGVAVYDSVPFQGYVNWLVFGGTSVGAPSVAGLIAAADAARGILLTTNSLISRFAYQHAATPANYASDYHDIRQGSNGTLCCTAGPVYDLVTGLGSPNADTWIANL